MQMVRRAKRAELRRCDERGWTIVQTMVAVLIAGIVAAVVVEIIIDRRCEADPTRSICTDR
jgi:type II secretory pathway pseudopilin PulG